MTGGSVIVLGPVGRNLGAGMSGELFVYDPDGDALDQLNDELVLPLTARTRSSWCSCAS